MAVYRNLQVEIPKQHVILERQANGAPALVKYVISSRYDRSKGYPVAKRVTIGHQCEDDTSCMHPTSQYANLFPERWAALTGQIAQETTVPIGLDAAVEAIGSACGIKAVLEEAFGDQQAGTLINAATETLRKGVDIPDRAEGAVVFEDTLSDEKVQLFRRRWAARCQESGIDAVWLCADPLQGDWENPGVEILEEGQKPDAPERAMYLVYAIAPDGFPVSFDLQPGGLEDGKGLDRIVDFLRGCGIQTKGVILLRGVCDPSLIRGLQSRNLAYLILMEEAPRGCDEAFAAFAERGKRDAVNWIPGTYLFGTQQPVQVFGEEIRQQTLALIYDHHIGDARITALLERLQRETEGHNQAEIQREMDRAGVYSVLSSHRMPLRDEIALLSGIAVSEKQYRLIWPVLESGTEGLQDSACGMDCFAVGFLAAILQQQIEKTASAADLDGNALLQELCGIETRLENGAFSYVHTDSETIQMFFRSLGADANQALKAAVQRRNARSVGHPRAPSVRLSTKTGHPGRDQG